MQHTRRISGPDRDVRSLVTRWQQDGDPSAREELLRRFLPLARRLAGRYRNPNEPFDDLAQVASIGLLGAIDRFDASRGVKFSSFATPTILGELKRHFRDTGWSVHVPRGAQELALRVEGAAQQLTTQTGTAPRIDEIAASLKISVEDALTGLEAGAAHYATGLDAPVRSPEGQEDLTLADTLGQEDERLGLTETSMALSAAFARLGYQERTALTLRMLPHLQQSESGKIMGCSQMSVSRLLRHAAATVYALMEPPTAEPDTHPTLAEAARPDP